MFGKTQKITLEEVLEYEPAHGTQSSHWILWTVFAFMIIFLVWAKLAIIDEVTVANGKVIPSTQVQIIQNLEGGIIKKILVAEGQIVQKDQEVIHIDNTRFGATYQEGQTRALAFELKIARLKAEVYSKPFEISDLIKQALGNLVQHEQELYHSHLREIQKIQRSLELASRELQMTKPLVKSGAASEVEILRLERQVNELQNQVNVFRSRSLDDLNRTEADFAALQKANLALLDRLNRTTILSPVKGIVKQIKITTQGGIAQPGMEIMQIVPIEDSLVVEAQVPPSDIGFIYQGQKATVKITAYDYSIYGDLEGTVEQISADTITNDKGESFYLIRVRTAKNYLGTTEKPLYIIPGMVASIDVLTGRKSILSYLLKPILKAKEGALRER